ncbi:MAG: ATPase, partial [Salinimicrobium sediminis]|nr:ATPase [Salinimicrobium sediminis]
MEYTYKSTHAQELKRLQALLSYNILDTPPQEEYDNLVKLVAIICNSPIAVISMLDEKRQWYKAKTGITGSEISKNETFCQYTLEQDGLLEIKDARNDARVKTLSHVEDENGIRFYAGVNLKSGNGYKIGT